MSTLHRPWSGYLVSFHLGTRVLDKSRLKTRSISQLVYFTLPTAQGNAHRNVSDFWRQRSWMLALGQGQSGFQSR